jgi:ABC-type transport system substrate-binding protein
MGCKAFFFLSLILLASCGKSKKQAAFSGGTFSVCVSSTYLIHDPAQFDDFSSSQILGQVYESLVSFNPKDLTIQPQIAKSFEIKKGGLLYEFTLRNDVLFHDFGAREKDRLLTSDDVLYSIERACKPDENDNPTTAYSLIYGDKLKGADAFYNGSAKSISGISVKGNVISLELNQPDFNFLAKMSQSCSAIVSRKLKDDADNCVGTGPFLLKSEFDTDLNIKLVKNEDYYLFDKYGNALPYLDTIEFIIQNKKLEQLEMFENGELSLIQGLPTSRITEMLEGRIEDFTSEPPFLILYNSAILRTDYYYFDMTDERFKDKRVRQAFNLAVNKDRIGQDILRNQFYELGIYGIVPPLKNLFRGYEFDQVKQNAYSYDPERAKKLLAEAGYPNGENFGNVILRFNIDDVHSAVADEFAKQIKATLGITVNIDGSTFERLSADQESGTGDIFRTAWIADYASPETFLQNFAGKFVPDNLKTLSSLNTSRYKNALFDGYFEKALNSYKLKERRKYLSLAEVELMRDPPLIPLWYSGELSVLYSKVRNFHFNSLNQFDFRTVYIKDWTKEEYIKSRGSKP